MGNIGRRKTRQILWFAPVILYGGCHRPSNLQRIPYHFFDTTVIISTIKLNGVCRFATNGSLLQKNPALSLQPTAPQAGVRIAARRIETWCKGERSSAQMSQTSSVVAWDGMFLGRGRSKIVINRWLWVKDSGYPKHPVGTRNIKKQ